MKTILLSLTLVAFASAKKWDGLSITWTGINPPQLPRTKAEAEADGWEVVGSGTCSESNNYLGIAYAKDGDRVATLLFDTAGYIAGIQAGIHVNEQARSGFPSVYQAPPLVLEANTNEYYVISAYFTDPSKICTKGRSQSEFESEGTGTNLYIQNGAEIMQVPNKQDDMATTDYPFVEGKCFITMGKHFWYNITDTMDCKQFFPLFVLYDDAELAGFGWAFTGNFYSKRFEHPGTDVFPLFMQSVPQCLNTIGTISTLHVFLTYNPLLNLCPLFG